MSTPPNVLQSDSGHSTTTRISDSRMLLGLRLTWFALLLIQLVSLIYLLPLNLTSRAIPRQWGDALEATGSAPLIMGIHTFLASIVAITALLLAIILMWRSGNERTAMLFSLVFVTLITIAFTFGEPDTLPPLVLWIQGAAKGLSWFSILLLFPDMRLSPPWIRYAIVGFTLVAILGAVQYFFYQNQAWLPFVIGWSFLGIVVGLWSFIYRYRHADALRRQQMKWLILPFLILAIATVVGASMLLLLPAPLNYHVVNFLGVSADFVYLSIPLAVGFAILRYRLWNVDLVINRSLVYGAVTAVLVAVFAAIIALVSALTQGQGQTVGILAAAGVAFALFNPVRRYAQNFVDHRIYRLRYDLNEVAAAQKKPDVKNPGLYTGRTFGQYEILGVIGKGGMGEVYKGFGDGKTVAIKVLPQDLAAKDEFRKRFTREAQTLTSLEHPNVVKLFGSGVSDDGVHFLAMEYIDGQELSEVIRQGALNDYDALRDWVNSIAAALDYIHAKGLVHRDLKPSNIMLRPSTKDTEIKEAVLMDFGIARVDATGTRITGSGAVGTIDYMSPEQIMAAREVDKRSDIYALGIIVYELLTGEKPFKGSAGQVLFAHLQQPPTDPRDKNSGVPRLAAHAVLKALAKDADERFASAGEFAAALE